jgi:membrane protein implicated in regulation of membrane protease activity
MTAAVIWLIAGIVLIAAEVLSGEFVLLMLGGAALLAAGSSALVTESILVGGVVFVVSAGLLVFAVRPPLRRRLERGLGHHESHVKRLVGASAVVVRRVDGHGGQVTIGGELWSARTVDVDDVLEPGEHVMVMEISGATALVVGAR